MAFTHRIAAGFLLIALTLWLQSAGMSVLIYWAKTFIDQSTQRLNPLRGAILMIRFAAAMTVLHISEILLWASFYRWKCLPSWESSFYFSATSYSTVGYGDVLLPQVWRNLGPIESLIGVLMCGMSVSALFAILTRILAAEGKLSDTMIRPSNVA
jgi:voltage-gated potassium channel